METLSAEDLEAAPAPDWPQEKLYTEQAVAIATFIGGPLGDRTS